MRTTTPRLLAGSFLGALCIHVALVACGSAGPTATPGDGGMLADVRDAIAEAVGDVLDAETPDAHAGGDGGTPACNCVSPRAEYSFSGGAFMRDGTAAQEPQADFSSAAVSGAVGRTFEGTPTVAVTATAGYYLRDNSNVSVACTFTVRQDRTIVPQRGGSGAPFDAHCRVVYQGERTPTGGAVVGSIAGGGTFAEISGVRVTELTDDRMTVTLPAFSLALLRSRNGMQVPDGNGSVSPITLRTFVPGAMWLTTPRTYRP